MHARRWIRRLIVVGTVGPLALPDAARAQTSCAGAPLAVQILGSGGPRAGGTRASAGYLVWRQGRAVAMIDAGGGTFLRFGEAGARLEDLAILAISHLHPDHVADLPALLWLSEQARTTPLAIAGPAARGPFPAFDVFLRRLFDASTGAFPFLAGTLGQAGQGVRLDVTTVDAGLSSVTALRSTGGVEVHAIGVPHGDVPAVAFRVTVDGRTMVFGADQNGSSPDFGTFAMEADVLVLHLAIPENAPEPLVRLHARPAIVGQVASRARAKRLVLGHLIAAPPAGPAGASRAGVLDAAVAEVRRNYAGPVQVGEDLACIVIP